MKKVITVLIFTVILLLTQRSFVSANNQEPKYKVLYDTLITTLSPCIDDEITTYYGYSKQYDLFNAEIVSIKRISGGFSFRVTVEVKTFEHAHNPPYGTETTTFEITPSGVKAIEFKHIGDKYEKLRNNFYNEVISDIKQSFSLNLSEYKYYSYRQLTYQSLEEDSLKSIYEIEKDIVMNKLSKHTINAHKNVISPVTYLKGDTGFILYKLSDGTNVLYKIEKIDNNWEVMEVQTKKGKVMKYELLWYM